MTASKEYYLDSTCWGLYEDNGKENGNYYSKVGYIYIHIFRNPIRIAT